MQAFSTLEPLWTVKRLDCLTRFIKAYLDHMNRSPWLRLVHFESFSAFSQDETLTDDMMEAVVSLPMLRRFDMHYIRTADDAAAKRLQASLAQQHPAARGLSCAPFDTNRKLQEIAQFMRLSPLYRSLALIDPLSSQLDWKIVEEFRGLAMDLLLVIPARAMAPRPKTLSQLFAADIQDIRMWQAQENRGDVSAESIVATLYADRLRAVFRHVSEPYSLMMGGHPACHLVFATHHLDHLKLAKNGLFPDFGRTLASAH